MPYYPFDSVVSHVSPPLLLPFLGRGFFPAYLSVVSGFELSERHWAELTQFSLVAYRQYLISVISFSPQTFPYITRVLLIGSALVHPAFVPNICCQMEIDWMPHLLHVHYLCHRLTAQSQLERWHRSVYSLKQTLCEDNTQPNPWQRAKLKPPTYGHPYCERSILFLNGELQS